MPNSTCKNCGGEFLWRWEEAFDKFGFGDGDGQVMTASVVSVLEAAGYSIEYVGTLHNTYIVSIKRDGVELFPPTTTAGYDDPRDYLPRKIVRLLDEKFPENGEVPA